VAKFNDFLIKFEAFVLLTAKVQKISIKLSENLIIAKNLGPWSPIPPDHDVPALALNATDLESTFQSA